MIAVSPTAKFDVIRPAGFAILAAVQEASTKLRKTITVTAGTDSHTEGAHPRGEAYDLRTRDLDPPDILRLYYWLTLELGPRFYVQYEAPTPSVGPYAMLAPITVVSPKATGPHLHLQLAQGATFA